MKKKLFARLALIGASFGLFITSGILEGNLQDVVDPFVDPIHYETPVEEVFKAPLDAVAEPGEPGQYEVKRVIIHYYNTDKKNSSREIYTWTTGGDSKYFKLIQDEAGDIDYWHVELDLTSTESAYAGKTFLNFIVKYQGTWDGQSQDTELLYESFPADSSGLVEIWTAPGGRGSVDIYATKRETQLEKVTSAYFTNWKTIHAVADATPKLYRLYALDKTYLTASELMQDRIKESRLIKTGTPTSKQFNITFNYLAHVNVQYLLETEYNEHSKTQSIIVTTNKLYTDTNFVKYYNYSGKDLGVTWTPEKTTFKVWAPTAGAIILNIYNGGTPAGLGPGIKSYTAKTSYTMVMQPGGVWEKTILASDEDGNLLNKYYTYTVYNSEGVNEICDPYAKACGVNGVRGMILDFSSTNPTGWNNLPLKWDGVSGYDIKTPQELSIYEVHVRDLTEDSTWVGSARNGSYKAFYEKGTTYTSNGTTVKTGFDHIEEMGVKAVQIMPFYDQDNSELFYYYKDGSEEGETVNVPSTYSGSEKTYLDYNWGYNPQNYNCLEGSYSSTPEDGAVRVREFKELVLAYANNANHTRITMDVVYNHVSSVSKSSFTKLMPLYYFRFNEAKDEYWNGSGCSNEVKSEAPMMRKFIVESLCWWASEYKIKGFRFDLMELIDMDTLKLARQELYKIDPDIYLYGEGWKAADSGLSGDNGGRTGNVLGNSRGKYAANHCHLGAFNDGGRNALKGGNDGGWGTGIRTPGWGFISQGSGDVGDKSVQVGKMMTGYNTNESGLTQDPRQNVNYASCHDNFTLYDQLAWTLSNDGGKTAPAVSDIAKAVASVESAVALSNGVAFILGGDELLRTKVEDHPEKSRLDEDYVKMYNTNISHNSYKSSPACNSFKWDRKIRVKGYKNDTVTMNQYWNAIANALKTRNSFTKFGSVSNSTTNADCNYWNTGDGGTKATWYVGGYVMMISGRASGNGSWNSTGKTKVVSVGGVTQNTNTSLGMYSFAAFKA